MRLYTDFLLGKNALPDGRTVFDIYNMTDTQIENTHDFIQWAFPTVNPSPIVPEAPVITARDLFVMKYDIGARQSCRALLAMMTMFYINNDHWLTLSDHNHKRISRIIESVKLTLGDKPARVFYNMVMQRNLVAGSPINESTLEYWDYALNG